MITQMKMTSVRAVRTLQVRKSVSVASACVRACVDIISVVCIESLLVFLLLVLDQLVNFSLGHGSVLGEDAVLVEARQQQQQTH